METTSVALGLRRVGQTGLIVGLLLLNTLQVLVLGGLGLLLVLGRAVRATRKIRPHQPPHAA